MASSQTLELWNNACISLDRNNHLECLENLIAINDKTAKVLFNLAIANFNLGHKDTSLEIITRAVEKDTHFAIGFFFRGILNYQAKEYIASDEDFQAALRLLREQNLIDYNQLGLTYKLYSSDVLHNLGLCKYKLNNRIAAIDLLLQADRCKSDVRHDTIKPSLEMININREPSLILLPSNAMFRPPTCKVKGLEKKDYLGKAKVLAVAPGADEKTGFEGPRKMVETGFSSNSDDTKSSHTSPKTASKNAAQSLSDDIENKQAQLGSKMKIFHLDGNLVEDLPNVAQRKTGVIPPAPSRAPPRPPKTSNFGIPITTIKPDLAVQSQPKPSVSSPLAEKSDRPLPKPPITALPTKGETSNAPTVKQAMDEVVENAVSNGPTHKPQVQQKVVKKTLLTRQKSKSLEHLPVSETPENSAAVGNMPMLKSTGHCKFGQNGDTAKQIEQLKAILSQSLQLSKPSDVGTELKVKSLDRHDDSKPEQQSSTLSIRDPKKWHHSMEIPPPPTNPAPKKPIGTPPAPVAHRLQQHQNPAALISTIHQNDLPVPDTKAPFAPSRVTGATRTELDIKLPTRVKGARPRTEIKSTSKFPIAEDDVFSDKDDTSTAPPKLPPRATLRSDFTSEDLEVYNIAPPPPVPKVKTVTVQVSCGETTKRLQVPRQMLLAEMQLLVCKEFRLSRGSIDIWRTDDSELICIANEKMMLDFWHHFNTGNCHLHCYSKTRT